MKEKEFINIIKNTLSSKYIGDDCAYLEDLGIVISQDSLVENVHFSLDYMNAYQLGYKSVAVNISDICASGAEPKYLTIALSLPETTDNKFIEEFYMGAKDASFGAEIVGGDITGADKIYTSIAAIGSSIGRKISSRSGAKVGQKVVISGLHGSSSAGLNILSGNKYDNLTKEEKEKFINAHNLPQPQIEFSKKIAESTNSEYAMMDTSDGLADALSAIAEMSGVMLDIDYDKIPKDKSLSKIPNSKNLVLYGGEDYGLVATTDNTKDFTIIGEVKAGTGIKLNYSDGTYEKLSRTDIESKLYKHFKE